MANFTITLSDSLLRKMRKYPQVSWEKVGIKAIEDKLQELKQNQ